MNMKDTVVLTGILEALIEHADWFFPEGTKISQCANGENYVIDSFPFVDVDFTSPKTVKEVHSPRRSLRSSSRKRSSSEESPKQPLLLLQEALGEVDGIPASSEPNGSDNEV